jgi:hypothetical protein
MRLRVTAVLLSASQKMVYWWWSEQGDVGRILGQREMAQHYSENELEDDLAA